MDRERQCNKYEEDDWGVCKHKKYWTDDCDNNCNINLDKTFASPLKVESEK